MTIYMLLLTLLLMIVSISASNNPLTDVQLLHYEVHKSIETHNAFMGLWSNIEHYPDLAHNHGKAMIKLKKEDNLRNKSHKLVIVLQLFDGQYRDDMIRLGLRFYIKTAKSIAQNEFTFSAENVEVMKAFEQYFMPVMEQGWYGTLEGTIKIDELITLKISNIEGWGINGTINVAGEVFEDERAGRVFLFVLANSAIWGWFWYWLCRMNDRLDEAPARGQKLSLTTIWVQAIWNFLLFNQYMNLAMKNSDFQYLAISSFVHFMIWFLFELKLILHVWKSNNQDLFRQGSEAVRRGLITFYVKFYIITLILLVCMDYVIFNAYFLMFFWGLIWVPQIYKNIRNKYRRINLNFIYSLTATQTFYAFYIKTWPNNVFELENNTKFSICFIISIFLQIFMLQLQRRYGSSIFLPAFMRSNFSWEIASEPIEDEWCIWMSPVWQTDDDEAETEVILYIQTPCGHNYHQEWLKEWMKQKSEWPFCRRVLPPLDDDDDDSE